MKHYSVLLYLHFSIAVLVPIPLACPFLFSTAMARQRRAGSNASSQSSLPDQQQVSPIQRIPIPGRTDRPDTDPTMLQTGAWEHVRLPCEGHTIRSKWCWEVSPTSRPSPLLSFFPAETAASWTCNTEEPRCLDPAYCTVSSRMNVRLPFPHLAICERHADCRPT